MKFWTVIVVDLEVLRSIIQWAVNVVDLEVLHSIIKFWAVNVVDLAGWDLWIGCFTIHELVTCRLNSIRAFRHSHGSFGSLALKTVSLLMLTVLVATHCDSKGLLVVIVSGNQ